MPGQKSSEFRIKLLVVHPDGRRQKFLVTFPERKTLKIDQRYIGIPLTLKIEFPPGAIVCKPGTGHTLTVGGKTVAEHSLSANDSVNLDQYTFEFLELPEPLPMDEATRFVSINEMIESTVVVSAPIEHNEPTVERSVIPHAAPPQSPAGAPRHQAPSSRRTPDPEDSTAIIRRLQVPGGPSGGNPYANLHPSMPSRVPSPGPILASHEPQDDTVATIEKPGWNRRNLAIALVGIAVVVGFIIMQRSSDEFGDGKHSTTRSEKAPVAETGDAAPEMKPMQIEPAVTAESKTKEAVPMVPPPAPGPVAAVPQQQSDPAALQTAVEPMGGKTNPVESPFDDRSGFDVMAVDAFFDAIDTGNEAKIKSLIEKRVVDVNLSRRKGYAALHVAAARGDLSIVKLLLKHKADPNVIDQSGATPLMWAVFRRHKPVVEHLAPKTDLKIERQGGETAYEMAKRLELSPYYRFLDPSPKSARSKRSGNQRVPTALPDKKRRK